MKLIYITRNLFKLFLIGTLNLIIISCTSNNIIIKPNYNSEEFSKNDLKREGVKIVKVIDNRKGKQVINPEDVGETYNGVFNSVVPFRFNDPVASYLENSLNKLICTDTSISGFVPVIVTIDTFMTFEKLNSPGEIGIFKATLNFNYPVTPDSSATVITKATEQVMSSYDVTSLMENQIYLGTRDCAKQFINVFDNSSKFKMNPDRFRVKYTLNKSLASGKNKTQNKEIDPENESKSDSESGIDFTYFSGNKIQPGFEINFVNYDTEKGLDFHNGFGIGLSVYNITKSYDIGYSSITQSYSFVGFHGKYQPRIYLSNTGQGLFLQFGLILTGGFEGDIEEGNFFFGPTLSESLGIKIGPLFFEGGVYQLALIGSKKLPNDLGYIFNTGFQF